MSAILEVSEATRPLPVLKWAGGKGRLLEQYAPHFPASFGAYYEPFVGSGAVFFHLRPLTRVRLSDTNSELINLYRIVQSSLESLLEQLQIHADGHSQEYYYQIRAQQVASLTPVERAARTLYLNRTCYNGLYRVNSKGQFNVPFGRYKRPRIVHEERLRRAAEALEGVELEVAPFESVLDHARAGDLVYFDPPYQPLSATSSFTAYTKDNFGEPEQRRLAEVFAQLHRRGAQVRLSNSDTPLIHQLYKDFRIILVRAPRFINSKADRREAISEVLITNAPGPGPRKGRQPRLPAPESGA